MKQFLNRYFRLDELQTTFRTELLAGVSTYLSLAYIFIVNPAILGNAGMNVSAVLFATVIASGLATLLMGLWPRLPFALAPGLEMNGFFAFVVCGTLNLTWQQGLGAVFWSGVLCIFMTWIPARQKIIDAIPPGLKINLAVSVGVFVGTIGLHLSKILVFVDGSPDFSQLAFSKLASARAIALYIGLAISLILGLKRLNFRAGMLVGIIVASVFCKINGIIASEPAQLSTDMLTGVAQIDWLGVFREIRLLPVLLVFFFIVYYASIGKFIGLTVATNLQTKGEVRNLKNAMYVVGIGTIVSASTGTSSTITYVESAVGIAAGGRSGVTAIVCGILMFASLAFTPLVGLVPVEATAGILIYVGILLMPRRQIRESPESYARFDLVIGIVMGILSFATFSLDKAMALGFCAYVIRPMVTRIEKVNAYLLASTIVLVVSLILQFLLRGKV